MGRGTLWSQVCVCAPVLMKMMMMVLTSKAALTGRGCRHPDAIIHSVTLTFISPSCHAAENTLLDFKRPAWSKIEGRRNIKSIEIYWSEQRAGLFSDPSLTKNQPRNTFQQTIYSMCRHVSSSHWSRDPSLDFPIRFLVSWSLQNMLYGRTPTQFLPSNQPL